MLAPASSWRNQVVICSLLKEQEKGRKDEPTDETKSDATIAMVIIVILYRPRVQLLAGRVGRNNRDHRTSNHPISNVDELYYMPWPAFLSPSLLLL